MCHIGKRIKFLWKLLFVTFVIQTLQILIFHLPDIRIFLMVIHGRVDCTLRLTAKVKKALVRYGAPCIIVNYRALPMLPQSLSSTLHNYWLNILWRRGIPNLLCLDRMNTITLRVSAAIFYSIMTLCTDPEPMRETDFDYLENKSNWNLLVALSA